MSTIKSWYIPMEFFYIYLSNSWIPEASLHWIVGGTYRTFLPTILMYRWKFELFLYSSPIEGFSNKFFDGTQSNSYDRRIFWHSWSSSLVGGCVTRPLVDPSVFIRKNRSSDASIPSFLCGSVGSSHIWIPNFWHWFGFISDFYILFTNHKPCKNSSITTSPEPSVKSVTTVHIGKLICSAYSRRNGDTMHFSEVNNIGKNLAPKKWLSVWFFISVANFLQITLSWFLCTLLNIWRSDVLMLNTTLFTFSSGTRSDSQVIVTRFHWWS